MWKTEKEFGQYIMSKLTKEGCSCIRIESASTISGMPDMYLLGIADDYFVEFKNMKDKSIKDAYFKIPWRPGQQAWALNYHTHYTKDRAGQCKVSKYSWTFVGLKDGVMLIRMSRYRHDDAICIMDADDYFMFSKEEFTDLMLRRFLQKNTYVVRPVLDHESDTWYDLLSKWVNCITIELYTRGYYPDIDMPCPEDYIDNLHEIIPALTVESLNEPARVLIEECPIIRMKKIYNYLVEMVDSIYNCYALNKN